MNLPITNAILSHIFSNFGITSQKKVSLKDHAFHVHESIVLADEDGKEDKVDTYGAQVFVEGGRFRVAYFKISNQEHALLVKLDDCPVYASYLEQEEDGVSSRGLIATQNEHGKWIECDVAMQATFLAGISRLNYIMDSWQPISESKDMIEMFKSYIEYVDFKSN